MCEESKRLKENYEKGRKWHHWGPYLSERQWGTVREDYSDNGDVWSYFTHDQSRMRAYRWGEDGIAGISDIRCNLCFSLGMWNGKDSILKERLFGLTGPEGNHGEDVKELYFYLENTPTHSYMKYLYKYSQNKYPYADLLRINKMRGLNHTEYEVLDTGIFDNKNYFDVYITYAKGSEDDILIKINVKNRSKQAADIWLLPTLLFRNEWGFKENIEKPIIEKQEGGVGYGKVKASHPKLNDYTLYFETPDRLLFTENDSNAERLFGLKNQNPYVKDLFHDMVTQDNFKAAEGHTSGTKFSPLYHFAIEGDGNQIIKLRLSKDGNLLDPLGESYLDIISKRKEECNEFYEPYTQNFSPDDAKIIRQGLAGMLWTKQFYSLDIEEWIAGDAKQPKPSGWRKYGRNHHWKHLINEDIISMPDKWEYPWYAAWDLAFHCIPLALIDPAFAKHQMVLMLREWYMSPKGQIPAYEWSFSDVNPPVQAWATYRIYEIDKDKTGTGDLYFLKRVFNKLVINFTWWINRKDRHDNNIFEGGFLGLDNIGLFDRSQGLPGGGYLEQADGTAWMALYSLNMLQMAIEIAQYDKSYEDMATKFFEHFVYIAEALNSPKPDGSSLWDEVDGFFFDLLVKPNNTMIPLKTRSLVGLMTINPVTVIPKAAMDKLPGFRGRLEWFRNYRANKGKYLVIEDYDTDRDLLLSLMPKNRLLKIMNSLVDEDEFLSKYGIRSLSKIHKTPYNINIDGQTYGVRYDPAESTSYMFGGNSNWRGPIWFPINYMIVEALREYYKYYGDAIKIECPAKSGNMLTFDDIAELISTRLINLFRKDSDGDRPVNSAHGQYFKDKKFEDLVLFYEYFHGETGRGLGASHQTGWTGLVVNLMLEQKKVEFIPKGLIATNSQI